MRFWLRRCSGGNITGCDLYQRDNLLPLSVMPEATPDAGDISAVKLSGAPGAAASLSDKLPLCLFVTDDDDVPPVLRYASGNGANGTHMLLKALSPPGTLKVLAAQGSTTHFYNFNHSQSLWKKIMSNH